MAYPFQPTIGGGEHTISATLSAEDPTMGVIEYMNPDKEADIKYLISLGVSPLLAAGIGIVSRNADRANAIDVESRSVDI